MDAKYVVMEQEVLHETTMLIFSKNIVHRDVARGIGDACNHPVSAGFIACRQGEFFCYGESESLNIASDPGKDSALANKMLGGQ